MEFNLWDLAYILPEVLLSVGGMLVLLLGISPSRLESVTVLSLGLLGAAAWLVLRGAEGTVFAGMFVADAYGNFFKMIFLLNAFLATLVSGRYLEARGERQGEYYAMLLFSTVGMMVMASAADLVSLYLGLELMALSTYVLAGHLRTDPRSNESALKYFLLGAFSSAFLLYAISLVYGLTGTTNLAGVSAYIARSGLAENPVMTVGLFLFVVAFGFKIAAVPFHMWAPDVYEGAATPVTAFMSVGPKAAGFAVMARVFLEGLGPLRVDWTAVLAVLAILTMAVGNVLALSQTNIKRMLAYSSVAHAGYALIGLITGNAEGVAAMMNYLMIYAFMNVGAFAVVIHLDRDGVAADRLDQYRGLSRRHPVAALVMLLFMFSLTGIPPTAGFVGKFYLFLGAVRAGHTALVVSAALFSVVSAYFYLRVVRIMYMEPVEAEEETPAPGPSRAVRAVLAISAVAVLGIGLYPSALLVLARAASAAF